jgi:hypothetical protein
MNTTTSAVAAEALAYFTTRENHEGSRIVVTRDDAPEWVGVIVRDAHGTDADGSPAMLPDDHRYFLAREALEFIAQDEDATPVDDLIGEAGEWADSTVPYANHLRVQWLGSHGWRASYCDEEMAELGGAPGGIMELVGWGMRAEAMEVLHLVLGSLRARLEEVA